MSRARNSEQLEPVPCPPCLVALLTRRGDEPHDCQLTTALAVDGDRLVVLAPELDCLCHCPLPEESPALKAARAQARGESAE